MYKVAVFFGKIKIDHLFLIFKRISPKTQKIKTVISEGIMFSHSFYSERQKKIQKANQQNTTSQQTTQTKQTIEPRSTKTVTRVPMGGFTYEEEVIETLLEEKPGRPGSKTPL